MKLKSLRPLSYPDRLGIHGEKVIELTDCAQARQGLERETVQQVHIDSSGKRAE